MDGAPPKLFLAFMTAPVLQDFDGGFNIHAFGQTEFFKCRLDIRFEACPVKLPSIQDFALPEQNRPTPHDPIPFNPINEIIPLAVADVRVLGRSGCRLYFFQSSM